MINIYAFFLTLLIGLSSLINGESTYFQSEQQIKLFACSILGKFMQDNGKHRARLDKYSLRFVEEYNSDYEQGYNVINLICLQSCIRTIEINHASSIITPSYKISSKDLKPLNLIGSLTVFDSYENKDKLLDELDELNLQLINFSKGLAELKAKKEADKKRKEDNIKRKQKEEEALDQNYKNGIKFQSKLDKDAIITVKKNQDVSIEKEFENLFDNKPRIFQPEIELENSEGIYYYSDVIYDLWMRFFDICKAYPEIFIGVFISLMFYFFKSMKTKRKKKVTTYHEESANKYHLK